jgi:hypothetical protein
MCQIPQKKGTENDDQQQDEVRHLDCPEQQVKINNLSVLHQNYQ